MAKKNDSGCAVLIITLVFLAASIAGLPFLLVSYFTRKHFAEKYDLANVPARVFDTTSSTIKGAMGIVILTGLLTLIGAFFIGFGFHCIFIDPHYLWAAGSFILGILFLICATPLAGVFGILQIGMLVFPKQGIFVIPADPAKNTVSQNILEGRWFTDMFHMEELQLADIERVTREGGTVALIHGKFGTRSIRWSNKQKRDECITTLERHAKRRLTTIY